MERGKKVRNSLLSTAQRSGEVETDRSITSHALKIGDLTGDSEPDGW
jgi:hypothetical protein